MDHNYRSKKYYPEKYDGYPRYKEKYRSKDYRDYEDYHRSSKREYNYYEKERSRESHRDSKYNYHKFRDKTDDSNDYDYNRRKDKYKSYHKYSRSRSRRSDGDYYYNSSDDDKSKYKKEDNWPRKRKKSSSSTSTLKNEKNKNKNIQKDKEKEKQPFVSAFTSFPFPLPEEITKNENYQKLYNNNNINNIPNTDMGEQNNLMNNPNNNRQQMINDPQFSLYTNPYLVQSLALLPTAPNTDKKLYIGNLPNGMTPPSLIKMLNIALLTLKPECFSPGDPVISAWVSPDGHYAFVEFRTAEEATKGFVLNGFKFLNVPLKVGRPKTYQGIQPKADEICPTNTVAAILMKNNNVVNVKKYKFNLPTKVLCLNNIIKGLNIEDEDTYKEIEEDIRSECEKYGKVLEIFMPRKDVEDNPTSGMGNAYVMFEDVEQSKLARKFLTLKRYNNKLIYIQYIPENNFINKNFDKTI